MASLKQKIYLFRTPMSTNKAVVHLPKKGGPAWVRDSPRQPVSGFRRGNVTAVLHAGIIHDHSARLLLRG